MKIRLIIEVFSDWRNNSIYRTVEINAPEWLVKGMQKKPSCEDAMRIVGGEAIENPAECKVEEVTGE